MTGIDSITLWPKRNQNMFEIYTNNKNNNDNK